MLIQPHSPNTRVCVQIAGVNSNLFKQMVHHSSIDRFYSWMYTLPLHTYTCVRTQSGSTNNAIYYAMGRCLPSPYEIKKWVNALGLNQSKWKYFLYLARYIPQVHFEFIPIHPHLSRNLNFSVIFSELHIFAYICVNYVSEVLFINFWNWLASGEYHQDILVYLSTSMSCCIKMRMKTNR